MPLLPRLSSLWRNLFHKTRTEQQLAEEIDAYLEMLVEQKIKEGLDPAEARDKVSIRCPARVSLTFSLTCSLPPSSISAARRASAGSRPSFIFCSTSISR